MDFRTTYLIWSFIGALGIPLTEVHTTEKRAQRTSLPDLPTAIIHLIIDFAYLNPKDIKEHASYLSMASLNKHLKKIIQTYLLHTFNKNTHYQLFKELGKVSTALRELEQDLGAKLRFIKSKDPDFTRRTLRDELIVEWGPSVPSFLAPEGNILRIYTPWGLLFFPYLTYSLDTFSFAPPFDDYLSQKFTCKLLTQQHNHEFCVAYRLQPLGTKIEQTQQFLKDCIAKKSLSTEDRDNILSDWKFMWQLSTHESRYDCHKGPQPKELYEQFQHLVYVIKSAHSDTISVEKLKHEIQLVKCSRRDELIITWPGPSFRKFSEFDLKPHLPLTIYSPWGFVTLAYKGAQGSLQYCDFTRYLKPYVNCQPLPQLAGLKYEAYLITPKNSLQQTDNLPLEQRINISPSETEQRKHLLEVKALHKAFKKTLEAQAHKRKLG